MVAFKKGTGPELDSSEDCAAEIRELLARGVPIAGFPIEDGGCADCVDKPCLRMPSSGDPEGDKKKIKKALDRFGSGGKRK